MKRGPKLKKFCRHGHDISILGRQGDGHCTACRGVYHSKHKKLRNKISREYYLKHKKRSAKLCKKWRLAHKKYMKKYQQKYNILNVEKVRKRKRKYWLTHKKQIRNWNKASNKRHPEMRRLNTLRKTKKRKKRIPKWRQKGIVKFYRNCPKNKQVDHVIPLLGKLVSGLYVRWNLQYLTFKQNNKKGNRIDLNKVSRDYGKLLKRLGLK